MGHDVDHEDREPLEGAVLAEVKDAVDSTLAMVPGAGFLVRFVAEVAREQAEKRFAESVRALEQDLAVAVDHTPDIDRMAAIRAALDSDPEAATEVIGAFRRMLEAIDDAAVPIIAALAGDYLHGQNRDPKFLRAAGRMFSASSTDQIDVMRDIIGPVNGRLRSRPDITRVEVVVTEDATNARTVATITAFPQVAKADGTSGIDRSTASARIGWEEAIALLKEHHLAADNAGGMALGVESGPHVLAFEARHLRYVRLLARVLVT